MKLNEKIIRSLINEILKQDELQDPNKSKPQESSDKDVSDKTNRRD